MVTVRRAADTLVFVTWGNADAALSQAWNALVWAFAEVGGGGVEAPQGTLGAATYRASVQLPAPLRS
jgi:hypothetical protein